MSRIKSRENKAGKKTSEGWVAWEESLLTDVGIEARSSEPKSQSSEVGQ